MMSQSHEHSKAKGIASQAMRCILLTSQEASTCPESTVIPSMEGFWGSCFGFGMVITPQNVILCVCVPPVAAIVMQQTECLPEMETNFLFLQFPLQHLQKSQTAIVLRLYSFLFHIKFTSMYCAMRGKRLNCLNLFYHFTSNVTD